MTRRPERYCPARHDKDIVGRTKAGTCAECNRIWSKERVVRAHNGLMPPRRIFSIVKRKGWTYEYVATRYAAYQHVNRDSALLAIRRLKDSKGLTVDQADIWCLVLGTDLYVVFPEAYRLKGVVA
jgi:hypothetical protein